MVKWRGLATAASWLGCFLATFAWAEQWPQFRGPRGDNAPVDAQLPVDWDATKNIRWKIPNSGEGWSAPVLWGNRLFLTAAVLQTPPATGENAEPERYQGGGGRRRTDLTDAVYRWTVFCYAVDTGKLLWQQVAREGNPVMPRHSTNTYATETPVTDGQRLYVYFGMMGVYAFDFDGNLVWQQDLGVYPMKAGWGTSSSPALHDDQLFLQVDNEAQSFVVALNTATGKEIWRANRPEPSQYSSPLIWKHSQRVELIVGGETFRSYDPATGEVLWQLNMQKGRSSASPLAAGDTLYVGTEFRDRGGPDDGGGYLCAVRAGASGDITPAPEATSSAGVQWRTPRSGIQMASPVRCGGYIYLFDRRGGLLSCLDAANGKLVYRQRVPRASAFWASPWVYDGKVFALDDNGTTHVIEPGPTLTVLDTNTIEEQFWASPALGPDALYLRGTEFLYCIANSAPAN